jgi:hypothetical protein
MANKNLLTYAAKLSEVEQVYYSPVAVLPQANTIPLSSIYCFLAKDDPWPLDANNNPIIPTPTQDQKAIKKVFKNIFAAKLIQTNDISPVIQRIDWITGTTYDYYNDDVDMFKTNSDGTLVNNFYVKNSYDQVFKCLWNNNDQPSTIEPYFEPGTYGTNNIFQSVDGYKWRFMYTIDTGTAIKFMDAHWIPVPVGANTPNPLMTSAGAGSIDVVNITNGGSGYDQANATVTIKVTGDGTGFAGTANVSGGVITDVVVTNPGTNYSYANVEIVSSLGFGATAISPTSPISGHGYDPVSELGATRIMLTSQFNGAEGGKIPTDITYYQVGFVVNPTTNNLNPYPANGSIYSTTTDLIVAPGFGQYVNDEIIWQGSTYESRTFSGTVLSFDVANNVAKLINTTGTLTTNAPIFGKNSLTTRTLLSYNTPDFVIFSGYMAYIENRSGVTRSPDGIEQIKIILGY